MRGRALSNSRHSSVSSAGVSLGVTIQAFMCVPGAMISVFMVILPENRLDRLEAATSLQDLAALPVDVIRDLRWQKIRCDVVSSATEGVAPCPAVSTAIATFDSEMLF